jgi:hypothetical protein
LALQKKNIVSDGKLIYLKFINTIWSSSIVLMDYVRHVLTARSLYNITLECFINAFNNAYRKQACFLGDRALNQLITRTNLPFLFMSGKEKLYDLGFFYENGCEYIYLLGYDAMKFAES